jgi:hypothetical protein
LTEARLIMLTLGCFLLTWGISLFARAAADRWVKRPLGPAIRRRAVQLGLIAVPLGVAWVLAGILLDWLWTGRPLGHDLGGAATLAACGVLTIGGGLGVAGMWFDRSRGRERCPACWFDLAAAVKTDADGRLVEVLCTECGRTVSRWKDLYRTRRERKLLWCAAACVPVAYLVIATPRVMYSGAPGLVPTTVLIAWIDRLPTEMILSDLESSSSLYNRNERGDIWHVQHAWLRHRLDRMREKPRDFAQLRIAYTFYGLRWGEFGQQFAPLLLDGLHSADQADHAFAKKTLDYIPDVFFWGPGGGSLVGREEDVMRLWQDPIAQKWKWWLLAECGRGIEAYWDEIDAEARRTTEVLDQQQQFVALTALSKRSERAMKTFNWYINGRDVNAGPAIWRSLMEAGSIVLAADLRDRHELHETLSNLENGRSERIDAARKVAKFGPCMRSYVLISRLRQDVTYRWTNEELSEMGVLLERVRFRVLE